ncbi:hypothetical protein Y1Q_0010569 [Alligator mississippiensis]|uniref:Uncharacterized protein n=1 Tax=Alligator mississippiensis TaxID=8496 RepID=A0A151PG64_ALLMI|nr:hypothetical protein Y1Q_0010569 [Alligator mississippiensis]
MALLGVRAEPDQVACKAHLQGSASTPGQLPASPDPRVEPELLQAGLAGCLTPPFMKTCCFPGFDLLA